MCLEGYDPTMVFVHPNSNQHAVTIVPLLCCPRHMSHVSPSSGQTLLRPPRVDSSEQSKPLFALCFSIKEHLVCLLVLIMISLTCPRFLYWLSPFLYLAKHVFRNYLFFIIFACEKGGCGTRGWHPRGRGHPQCIYFKRMVTPKKIVTLYMAFWTG